MTFQLRSPIVAALAAALSFSAAAFAEDTAGAPSTGPSHAEWVQQMQAHREARIRALHTVLNIRPDQEAAFQAFTSSLHPAADHEWRRREAGALQETLTTPQRLDRMAQRIAERQTAFQHRADAARTFYAALSPEQQRTFDALLTLRDHGMGRGLRGRGGFGGPEHG